jgi:hypothetical protein
MKTALLVLLTGAASFAAGWFSKPSEKTGAAVPDRAAVAKTSAAAPREANPYREALAAASGTGGAVFQPFRTADEVLALAEGLMEDGALDEMEETAFIEMIEALPRLMVTDLSVVRSLLDQIAAAPKSQDVRLLAAAMLAGRWILQDPEAATGYVFANPAVFCENPSREPGGSQTVLGEDDDVGNILALFGIAMTARRNPGAAETMLDLLPEVYLGDIGDMLTMLEAKADPAKFLTTTPLERLEAMDDFTPILARWAKQDPQAALSWTQTLEDPDDDAWTAIARGWADKDRAAATAWASSLTDADHRRASLTVIASKAVDGLDAAAAEVALAVFPREVAASVRLEDFTSGDHDPAEAAAMVREIVSQYSGDSELMEAAAGPAAAVIDQIASEENGESKAAAWLATLPEGAVKSRAASALIDQWAEEDPAAASAWIKALPAGDTRERATIQLISEISNDDPASALEWARSISSEETRLDQARSVLRHWLQENPHMAMEALTQFSAEEQSVMFRE